MAATLNIQPLRPNLLFTDSKGQLTKEAYDFLFAIFKRVGGSLDSLNAATLQTFTWEQPGPIGAVTPSSGKFTTFACNGKNPQVSYTFAAPATDLATAIVLLNQIRTALINNGIGV